MLISEWHVHSAYLHLDQDSEQDALVRAQSAAGRNALELVLAIYKSQKEGMPVKLPLEEFHSTDMAGEFDV